MTDKKQELDRLHWLLKEHENAMSRIQSRIVELQIDIALSKRVTPEERFAQLIKGCEKDYDFKKYPNSLFIHSGGDFFIEHNVVTGYCWYSYKRVWSVFQQEFGYNTIQIRHLLARMCKEHFGWDVKILSGPPQTRDGYHIQESFGWSSAC